MAVDRKRLAQIMIDAMAASETTQVCWGDPILVTVGRQAGYVGHPLDVMQKTTNALRASPRFENVRFRGHDSRGRPRITTAYRVALAQTSA